MSGIHSEKVDHLLTYVVTKIGLKKKKIKLPCLLILPLNSFINEKLKFSGIYNRKIDDLLI